MNDEVTGYAVETQVNGSAATLRGEGDSPLLAALRTQLGLVGTRFGCGLGQCGACVVLLDGAPVTSCDLPLRAVRGRSVVTIEGLAQGAALHRVQRAVLQEQAGQCGYCLSGIMVRAAALLERDPEPDEDAVLDALDAHLCRCGVQRRVVRAVLGAARGAR